MAGEYRANWREWNVMVVSDAFHQSVIVFIMGPCVYIRHDKLFEDPKVDTDSSSFKGLIVTGGWRDGEVGAESRLSGDQE